MIRNTLILLSILLFSSCKKENIDYRDSFIGNYRCHETGSTWSLDTIYARYDTIVEIDITKSGDSSINILDVTVKINAAGIIEAGLYSVPNYHGFGGYFKNDSIFLDTFRGGLGGGTTLNYKGKKV